ncbi:hypothetical protein D3C77_738200 [compost metagenome]
MPIRQLSWVMHLTWLPLMLLRVVRLLILHWLMLTHQLILMQILTRLQRFLIWMRNRLTLSTLIWMSQSQTQSLRLQSNRTLTHRSLM